MTYFTEHVALAPSAPRSATGIHNHKYFDQFLMVLHATFTTGLVFVRQLKQGATSLCLDHNYT